MKKGNFTKKKEEKSEVPVCQDCMTSDLDLDYYWISVEKPIIHNFLSCEKCVSKLKHKINPENMYKKPRVKKKINTKGWIEGDPTSKGNKRYIFIDSDGNEFTLVAETGLKKGLKPKIQS